MVSHVHIQECDLSDSSDQFFTLSSELMSSGAWQAVLLPACPACSASLDAGGLGVTSQSEHPSPGHPASQFGFRQALSFPGHTHPRAGLTPLSALPGNTGV